jgi:hypothetical protein
VTGAAGTHSEVSQDEFKLLLGSADVAFYFALGRSEGELEPLFDSL